MRRIIVALTALFSAFLLSFTASPATATHPSLDTTERATRATTERAAPPHTIRRLRAGEIRNSGRFFVTGKVLTARGKFVYLQKANRKAGPYRNVKKDRTARRNGRFRMTFDGRVGTHWQIVVKRTPRNRTTKVYIGRICRNC